MEISKRVKNVGNVKYKHEPRGILSFSLVGNDSYGCMLKLYEMLKPGNTFDTGSLFEESYRFLNSKIKKGEIKKHSGLGFAILSEDMLNVARWDKDYPIVLRNDIYTFENYNIKDAKLEDIDKVGAFCMWELKIVDFERLMWLRYLQSDRKDKDKKEYLDTPQQLIRYRKNYKEYIDPIKYEYCG